MVIDQISLFLENKAGRLAEVSRVLGEQNIDIRALTIADTTDFGVLRLIVNNPEQGERILKENDFTVRTTKVIAVEIADEPGGLFTALKSLEEAQVDIEYLYAFVSKINHKATVIMKVSDCDKAIQVLISKGIRMLNAQEVFES